MSRKDVDSKPFCANSLSAASRIRDFVSTRSFIRSIKSYDCTFGKGVVPWLRFFELYLLSVERVGARGLFSYSKLVPNNLPADNRKNSFKLFDPFIGNPLRIEIVVAQYCNVCQLALSNAAQRVFLVRVPAVFGCVETQRLLTSELL